MAHFTLLPSPPAPSGIDQWPPPPEEQLCWTESLPDQKISIDIGGGSFLIGTLKNQTLSVYGKYMQLLQGTVTKATSPLIRRVTVTRGTSTTVSESTTISASFGVSLPGIGDLGAKIDQTVGYSQTWHESKSTEDTFNITTDNEKVSAIWWQARFRYVFNAQLEPGPPPFGDFAKNYVYPMEIILDCDTFSSSQFPANVKIASSILKGAVVAPNK